jgi:hypothetical protein
MIPTHCPFCGLIRPDLAAPGQPCCLPRTCPMWSNVAVYDHRQRKWLRVDIDGTTTDQEWGGTR